MNKTTESLVTHTSCGCFYEYAVQGIRLGYHQNRECPLGGIDARLGVRFELLDGAITRRIPRTLEQLRELHAKRNG
jgi:hypothetical protein